MRWLPWLLCLRLLPRLLPRGGELPGDVYFAEAFVFQDNVQVNLFDLVEAVSDKGLYRAMGELDFAVFVCFSDGLRADSSAEMHFLESCGRGAAVDRFFVDGPGGYAEGFGGGAGFEVLVEAEADGGEAGEEEEKRADERVVAGSSGGFRLAGHVVKGDGEGCEDRAAADVVPGERGCCLDGGGFFQDVELQFPALLPFLYLEVVVFVVFYDFRCVNGGFYFLGFRFFSDLVVIEVCVGAEVAAAGEGERKRDEGSGE